MTTARTHLEARYRRHGGNILIELDLADTAQLFNSLDPSPFHEKDLDDDAEEYIVSTAREFALDAPLKLAIYLPPEAVARDEEAGYEIAAAIHNYFEYKTELSQGDLREKLRQGRFSLAVGLGFLSLCLGARELVADLGDSTLYDILQEGLLISGWVAMWRPIQIFLYDWWPIQQTNRLYGKLAKVRIEVRAHAHRHTEKAARDTPAVAAPADQEPPARSDESRS